jgi:hypothetical protein
MATDYTMASEQIDDEIYREHEAYMTETRAKKQKQLRDDILRLLDELFDTDSTTPTYNELMEELCDCYERRPTSVLSLGISADSLFQVIRTFNGNFSCEVPLHQHMQNPLYMRVYDMNNSLIADYWDL